MDEDSNNQSEQNIQNELNLPNDADDNFHLAADADSQNDED